jgi:hypothetical protein
MGYNDGVVSILEWFFTQNHCAAPLANIPVTQAEIEQNLYRNGCHLYVNTTSPYTSRHMQPI